MTTHLFLPGASGDTDLWRTTADMLTWQGTGGFSIDASVRIEGHDRHGIERLVRYCARPPFALHRLHAMGGNEALTSPDARLLYRLPGPAPDGRTVLLLSPLELLQRLARLVPPPRIHRHRYHGVLAPNARLRPVVVALRDAESTEEPPDTDDGAEPPELSGTSAAQALDASPSSGRSARISWAQLLARIYEVLPLLCPSCGGEMRILAFLTEPPVVRSILVHLGLPHRPPLVAPARGPPQGNFLLDRPTTPRAVPPISPRPNRCPSSSSTSRGLSSTSISPRRIPSTADRSTDRCTPTPR